MVHFRKTIGLFLTQVISAVIWATPHKWLRNCYFLLLPNLKRTIPCFISYFLFLCLTFRVLLNEQLLCLQKLTVLFSEKILPANFYISIQLVCFLSVLPGFEKPKYSFFYSEIGPSKLNFFRSICTVKHQVVSKLLNPCSL